MTVVLKINGAVYDGWTAARVTRGIDRAAGDFDLTVTQGSPSFAVSKGIRAGDKCTVEVNGIMVITGYVDEISPSYDNGSHEIAVRGRSKTCDLIDCSAMNKPGQWRGMPLLDIAKAIAKPFGITVRVADGTATKRVADFSLQQGETAYAAIERLCRLQGFLASDDEEGNLIITRIGGNRSAGTIQCTIPGPENNVLQGSGTFNVKERFSEYTVKGQSAGSDDIDGETARSSKSVLKDSNVTRYRPLLVVAEGNAGGDTARQRAAWERSTRAAKSIELNYTVAGWISSAAGDIWRVNTMVPVNDAMLGVAGDFLIGEVSFSIGSGGSTTALKLCPPDAYKPDPSEKDSKKKEKASSSASAWADEDEE